MRQGPQEAPRALNVDVTGQTQPATSEVQAEPHDPALQTPESEEAAAHVIEELKRVQLATESGVAYAEYDKMLLQLEEDVNHGLAKFSGQSASDKTFRQEAAAAVREHAAARKWWKTTNEPGSVFNAADRDERLQVNWALAKTHIENAEQALSH